MTNEQKYKTAGERIEAFRNYCNPIVGNCGTRCKLSEPDKSGGHDTMKCFAYWLALEAEEEEKPEPCPFCGGETQSNLGHLKVGDIHYWVNCISPDCMYRSAHYTDKKVAIAAHNRVCRAVKAAKEGEVK